MIPALKQLLTRPSASQPKPAAAQEVSRADLERVQALVVDFLTGRDIPHFKVAVRQGSTGQVLIMVEALPNPNLRHSNLMEFDIRRAAEKELNIVVGPVFWRFMIGDSDEDEALHASIRNRQTAYAERCAAEAEAKAKTEHERAADETPEPSPAEPAAKPELPEHYRPADTLQYIEVSELSLQDMRSYLLMLDKRD